MRGDTSVGQIFQEVGYLCMSDGCSFTLVDIDTMYPYEREAYVKMLQDKKKAQAEGLSGMSNGGQSMDSMQGPHFDPAMGVE